MLIVGSLASSALRLFGVGMMVLSALVALPNKGALLVLTLVDFEIRATLGATFEIRATF